MSMDYIKGYRCTICGKFFKPSEVDLTCPLCGEKGILDVEYDYDKLKKVLNKKYFEENKNFSSPRYLDSDFMVFIIDGKKLKSINQYLCMVLVTNYPMVFHMIKGLLTMMIGI